MSQKSKAPSPEALRQLETTTPDWLLNSELAQECVSDVRSRLGPWRTMLVVRQLTLLNVLASGEDDLRRHLRSRILKVGQRFGRAVLPVQELADSPAALLAPQQAATLFSGLRSAVLALEHFFGLVDKSGRWDHRLRAWVTVELQSAFGTFADREVAELVAIALGREPKHRRSAGTSAELVVQRQLEWRSKAASAQKRWRLRHKSLVEKARAERKQDDLAFSWRELYEAHGKRPHRTEYQKKSLMHPPKQDGKRPRGLPRRRALR